MRSNTDFALSPQRTALLFASLSLALLLSGCGQGTGSGAPSGQDLITSQADSLKSAQTNGAPLRLVASTSIIADVTAQVGGDYIELSTLIPRGTDPHAYQPTPGDLQALYQANLILLNGFDLEIDLEEFLAPVSHEVAVLSLSEGLQAYTLEAHEHAEGDQHDDEITSGLDPHVWFDPNQVVQWVDRIELALSRLDPDHAAEYTTNARQYTEELSDLDAWIQEQVASIPVDRRNSRGLLV